MQHTVAANREKMTKQKKKQIKTGFKIKEENKKGRKEEKNKGRKEERKKRD